MRYIYTRAISARPKWRLARRTFLRAANTQILRRRRPAAILRTVCYAPSLSVSLVVAKRHFPGENRECEIRIWKMLLDIDTVGYPFRMFVHYFRTFCHSSFRKLKTFANSCFIDISTMYEKS